MYYREAQDTQNWIGKKGLQRVGGVSQSNKKGQTGRRGDLQIEMRFKLNGGGKLESEEMRECYKNCKRLPG